MVVPYRGLRNFGEHLGYGRAGEAPGLIRDDKVFPQIAFFGIHIVHALRIAATLLVLSLVSQLLPDTRARQTTPIERSTALPITQPFSEALDR
jgi:hypothetical protein